MLRAVSLSLALLMLAAMPAAAVDTPGVIVEPPSMIVFFDYDSAELSDVAAKTVADAVRFAKAHGFTRAHITGHDDTVATPAQSEAIALRRAEAVRDAMVRDGFDAGHIVVEGKGAREPLVPTGPGVREPQNRRATFDFER